MKSRFLRWGGGLLLALTLACSLMVISASAAEITGVTLDPTALILDPGDTAELTAIVLPEGTTGVPYTLTWSLEGDTNSVTYSQVTDTKVSVEIPLTATRGDVCIIRVKLTVTGTAKEYTSTCPVSVRGTPDNSIVLSPVPLTIQDGTTASLTATSMPSRTNITTTAIWSISPSTTNITVRYGVVSVPAGTPDGTQVVVTATHPTIPSLSASCEVRVRNTSSPPSSPINIKLEPQGVSIPLGETLTLKATVEAPEGVTKTLTWYSTNQGKINFRYPNPSDTSTVEIYLTSAARVNDEATIVAASTIYPNVSAVCAVRVVGAKPPKISSVEITTSPTTNGRNYVDPGSGSALKLQAVAYPASAPEEDRRILWTSSDPSIASVDRSSGTVTGHAPGEVVIRATAQGDSSKYAERTVEVSGLRLSYLKKSTTGGQGTTVELTKDTEVSLFQYRDIVVSYKAFGNAVGKTINWESSNPTVAQVVNGRVTGNYPGSGVTITASAAGTTCSSSFKVRVAEDVADAITTNMGTSPSYSFSNLLSLLNARSQSKAGAPLDCVYSLKVSTANGTLYYQYKTPETPGHGVGGTERYYYQPNGQTQRALREVSFVPLPGFNGTAVVEYIAMATNGSTFSGTIRIEAATNGDVSYSTGAGQPVSFSSDFFSSVCQSRNGRALRYVTFTQPPASQGTLYYNYSPSGQFSQKVGSATRYYASSTPSIDNVSFVPAEGYTGTVTVSYQCVDSAGSTYSGSVTIRVGSGGGSTVSGTTVEYTFGVNQQQTFSIADFDRASTRATGVGLNYIRFNRLPAASAGILYLNYTGSSSTRVSAGTNYYLASSPLISSITFVPASGYSGTVTIPYTGTNSSGGTFSGNVILHVGTAASGGGTVHYTISRGQTVTLRVSDFSDACLRFTGETLGVIRFTSLPAESAGVLYYGYVSATSTGSRVLANTDYRREGTPSLSSITFVPASGYSGTVTIPFTGYSDRGTQFSGTLTITVEGGGSSAASYSIYYTGCSLPIDFMARDFQTLCQATLGNALSYVKFTATPTVGRLYQGYSSPAKTGAVVNNVAQYKVQDLGQISYIPKAEYQGIVTISFTMYDAQGGSASGVMGIDLSKNYCRATFTDIESGWDWAKPSIEYLRDSGVTSGYKNNTYRPGQPISRGEFTLMICRAFQFPTSGSTSFKDVPRSSAFAGAIASAQRLGIVQGTGSGRFQPDRPITRQSAMTMICRAIQAAGQSLPEADAGILSNYADGSRVSAHARSSVAALIEMGAVRGNNASRLNPGAAISRAEMAVILHRVLTR